MKTELISEAIQAVAANHFHSDAFVLEDGTRTSFAQVSARSAALADAPRAIGATPDDRIAFAVPRGVSGMTGFIGISSVAVCCPFNPRLKSDEFVAFFRSLDIAALVVSATDSGAVAAARSLGIATVQIDETVSPQALSIFGHIAQNPIRSQHKEQRFALLMQTSGTTCNPKLVLLTHANILSAARGIVRAFGLGPDDLCFNPMPLHHVHGLISAGISSLLATSTCYLTSSFTPKSFNAAYARLQPTWFTASPAMHLALLEYYRTSSVPANPRLKFVRSSSAPLPAALIAELEALFHAPLIETYGLTETA